ncbi:hypothetical protein ACQEXU_07195 [Vibrio sp. TRT 21S02]|uniref:hypothetical protein n=1 Tax=Vibrio sp. TRT 21S02 TaxID=3418507 RepID=UPI003CF828DD
MLNRTFILTLFAVTALFFSSVAVSVQAGQETFSHSAAGDFKWQVHPVECPKSEHQNEINNHHCCASVCLLKIPCSQNVNIISKLSVARASIHPNKIGEAISRIQTLFRPPIV